MPGVDTGNPGAEAGSPGEEAAAADSGGNAPAATPNPPDTYVQLFKWRWKDIARECTTFLGPNGFGAVQISPPQECIADNTWWNMYQPVNYQNLVSDMGTAADLAAMFSQCHAAGVRIYVDAVLNHASTGSGMGGGGSAYDENTLTYPLFGPTDFHANCAIQDSDYSSNRNNVVNCRLLGLPDLATDTDHVRTTIAAYLKSLIDMGADGFRLDAAKYMWPADIQAFFANIPQTTRFGEPVFVTQEITPDATAKPSDYYVVGTINEFNFTYAVRDAFRGVGGVGISQLPARVGTDTMPGALMLDPSEHATVFVDNHDTERSRTDSLNMYDDGQSFHLAMIYMLGQPYGRAQLQSGFIFSFTNTDMNAPTTSPYDANGGPQIMVAWDFVHRWPDVYPMVAFRSATAGQPMSVVQTGRNNSLAFNRGNVGFVALNNDTTPWQATLATRLPAGTYCNIVHGLLAQGGSSCTSDSVTVDASGQATITLGPVSSMPTAAVAIYTGQRVH